MYIHVPLFSWPLRAWPKGGALSQLVMGDVTCHTCHGCMMDFRPILGNPMGVTHVTSPGHVSGCIQDWEHMQCPGTCGALMYLQGVTQGEQVPAECLSRSVIIMYKSKYIHGGLYLSRREKKAAFSSYSSLALYNGQVMWRKELNKKAVTHY